MAIRTLQPNPCLLPSANHSAPLSLVSHFSVVLFVYPFRRPWCSYDHRYQSRLRHSTAPLPPPSSPLTFSLTFARCNCVSTSVRTACPPGRGVMAVTLAIDPRQHPSRWIYYYPFNWGVLYGRTPCFFWPIRSGQCTKNCAIKRSTPHRSHRVTSRELMGQQHPNPSDNLKARSSIDRRLP